MKKSKEKEIRFNSRIPEYAFLSAFYPGPFIAPLGKNFVLFPNREAYYQAHKTKDKNFRSKIINQMDPSRSKYFGAAKSGCPIIEGFDPKRKDIMREAIRYQMTQNPLLNRLLNFTGKAKLIEEAPWDEYFGTGRDGKGKNIHGKLLQEHRDEFTDNDLGPYLIEYSNVELKVYPYIQPTRD